MRRLTKMVLINANDKTTDLPKSCHIITDGSSVNRLAVDGVFSPDAKSRVTESVQEYSTYGTSDTKASYTVTTGKVLFIQAVWATLGNEATTLALEVQEDGTGFASLHIAENGPHNNLIIQAINPLGPFAAGVVIRIQRVQGDSGKEWAAGFTGYEEDA